MRSTGLSFRGFLAFAIVAACGGASNTDLGAGGGGGSSGGASGSGSSSGGGSNGGGHDASTQPDTGEPDVQPVKDSGPVEDVPTVMDVVQPMETGPIGPAVFCPMSGQPAMCMQGDVCCVTGDAMLGTQMDTCEHQGQPCAGAIVRCASGADCPKNEVCCGQKNATGMMYSEVACRQTCTGTGQVTFCDPQATPTDCTQPTAPNCVQSTLLQGFTVCGP
jgi:hypothetical protein